MQYNKKTGIIDHHDIEGLRNLPVHTDTCEHEWIPVEAVTTLLIGQRTKAFVSYLCDKCGNMRFYPVERVEQLMNDSLRG